MTYDEFELKYKPINNPRELSCIQFDSSVPEDMEIVNGTPINRIWTEVEADSPFELEEGDIEPTYVIPGVHVVNKISYLITEIPWDDDAPDEVIWD